MFATENPYRAEQTDWTDLSARASDNSAMSSPGSAPTETPRSLGELVGEITSDLSTLMRQEVELAKAEATQSAKRAGKGAGMFGGAGVAGHFVLLFLSISLWWALGDGMGHGWSALIVAAIWAVIAVVLAWWAARSSPRSAGWTGPPRRSRRSRMQSRATRRRTDEQRSEHPRSAHPGARSRSPGRSSR